MRVSSVLCLTRRCKDRSRGDLHLVPVRGELAARGTSLFYQSLSARALWATPGDADAVVFSSIPPSRFPNAHTLWLTPHMPAVHVLLANRRKHARAIHPMSRTAWSVDRCSAEGGEKEETKG